MGKNFEQIDIGQGGSAYLADADVDFTPPSGKVVIAITSLDDATEFNTLTPDNTDDVAYMSTATQVTQNGTNADVIPASETFPAGVTLYGRWTKVQIDAGAVLLYFGQ